AAYFSNRFLSNMLDHGLRNNIALGYSLKGKILYVQEKFREALSFYRKALRLHEAMGNQIRIAETKIAMARALIRTGQYHDAQRLAEEALAQAKSVHSVPRQSEAYELLAGIYEHLKQNDKALFSLSQFHTLDKK